MHRGVRSRTLKGLRRLRAMWNAGSDMEMLAAKHRGHVMNKWSHYFAIYDRHFARLRAGAVTLVEIGVAGGGSLDLWRQYFGPRAQLIGIDTNPECRRFEAPNTRIFIGRQEDVDFLERVAAEVGPIDILIDDGSHRFADQLVTFRTLFPRIKADGLYCCEDLCSSYWEPEYGGGVGKAGTYVEFLKGLIDELNAWFWRDGVDKEPAAFARAAHGMHFYPALIIIEKRAMAAPILNPVGHTAKLESRPAPMDS
ncbi:MAG: class I SAM-dependent methyltransferase [Proteobacteria bacterium]|nr:class I SAM-dependent methyltransferase [Pseudomonadota bacterium]